MRKTLLLTLTLLVAATAFGQATTTTLTFDIAGMTCAMCEENAEKALRRIRGVTSVDVDLEAKRGTLTATREVSKGEVKTAMAMLGFDAGFKDAPLVVGLSAEERAKLDIAVVSKGEEFDLPKHLAKGKVTIVDFWAEWCGPCHALTPKIERLVRDDKGIALRTIELPSWESASAKQATKDFRLPGLPYVRVYGADGKFIGAVTGNDFAKIKKLVDAAR